MLVYTCIQTLQSAQPFHTLLVKFELDGQLTV